jgi:hypothetical protein
MGTSSRRTNPFRCGRLSCGRGRLAGADGHHHKPMVTRRLSPKLTNG